MAAVHHNDGIGSEPPIARVRSNAEVHVASITDATMQCEALVGFRAITEHGRAVRHAALLVYSRAGMSLITANFLVGVDTRVFRSAYRFIYVRPGSLTFGWLNALACRTRLNVFFCLRFGFRLGLLLLFVSRRLRADRQREGTPHRDE